MSDLTPMRRVAMQFSKMEHLCSALGNKNILRFHSAREVGYFSVYPQGKSVAADYIRFYEFSYCGLRCTLGFVFNYFRVSNEAIEVTFRKEPDFMEKTRVFSLDEFKIFIKKLNAGLESNKVSVGNSQHDVAIEVLVDLLFGIFFCKENRLDKEGCLEASERAEAAYIKAVEAYETEQGVMLAKSHDLQLERQQKRLAVNNEVSELQASKRLDEVKAQIEDLKKEQTELEGEIVRQRELAQKRFGVPELTARLNAIGSEMKTRESLFEKEAYDIFIGVRASDRSAIEKKHR
ncbi:hypothetical protein D3C80_17130 [compost metagenome]